ncbi:MAG TPA: gamma-glutamyltransferase [Acidimicrobiia bacterium]|nr:gamma-glutamyltransferase [Acidimicrobiia bacterium]
MVATSSALGTAAALEAFRRGGNAVDAAVAADAALGVVQPMRTGLGGDLFALIEHDGAFHAYNGSGALPAGFVPPEGPMPAKGGATMTVPGLVAAWETLHARFGAIDLRACLEPAIALARDGFPLGVEEAAEWMTEARALAPDAHEMFLPGGRAPTAGQTLANPAQARVLETIADRGPRAFYEEWPAERVARTAGEHGSALTVADLAAHRGEWIEPLPPASYRDWEVVELPPNGQGAVVVGALAVLDDGSEPELLSSRRVHRHAEAVKAAFTEAATCIADPNAGGGVGRLRDREWAAEARRALDGDATTPPPEALPMPGGTVYVAVADGTTTVSLISSNYAFMGSGVVVDGGGFVLQNRGAGFRAVTPGAHPNNPAPGRRPFHTIIPALVRHGRAGRWGALGVTGGQFQPQGHVQVLHHLACGLDVQSAIDAPRWHWLGGTLLGLEPGLVGLAPELGARGHTIVTSDRVPYGAGQVVLPVGGYWHGGADPRQDSLAAGM